MIDTTEYYIRDTGKKWYPLAKIDGTTPDCGYYPASSYEYFLGDVFVGGGIGFAITSDYGISLVVSENSLRGKVLVENSGIDVGPEDTILIFDWWTIPFNNPA
jgi:hypothetical protein